MRRDFTDLNIQEAMDLVPARDVTKWALNVDERSPSDILIALLGRLDSFDLVSSEPAKVMLIDALLGEIIPCTPNSKFGKGSHWKRERSAG